MYEALYRKWRPQTFDDVISQGHVTDTLKSQIRSGKTAHAYLFTGSRGTGKTTCARIFAKALCCLNCTDGNPCLNCEICRSAERSELSDIIEIDAASNNSVEDIRELREGAIYFPERCKYKVYIIDEVHMLSTSAFNALLKIMEEPPKFVKFILATTEINKVPATILSRCQRFDFKRIAPRDISNRLTYIAKSEGFTISEEASFLIAKLSDGGMRDAISSLDQCSAYSESIDEQVVSSCLGISGKEYIFDILACLPNNDVGKIFEIVDRLYSQSKDLSVLCSELISQLRNAMVLKVSPAQKTSIACMPNELDTLMSITESWSLGTILRYLESLEGCQNRLPRSSSQRTELEITFASICSENFNTTDNSGNTVTPLNNGAMLKYNDTLLSLVSRLNALEDRVSSEHSSGTIDSSKGSASNEPPVPYVKPNVSVKKAEGHKRTQPIEGQWKAILNELNTSCPSIWVLLKDSTAELDAEHGCVSIFTGSFFVKDTLKDTENGKILGNIIDKVLGSHYKVVIETPKVLNDDTNNNVQNSGQSYNINNLVEGANSKNIPTSTIG